VGKLTEKIAETNPQVHRYTLQRLIRFGNGCILCGYMALETAIYSFVLFAVGAVIPVVPFMFASGITAIILSVAGSAAGLFLIGAAITLFTGKSIWFSGFRQVLFGLMAAAITFGIGKLIGVSLAG
jgi:vacuolar iron transporter family protein